MIKAMEFKGTGGVGKHEQSPFEVIPIEKRPKGLGLGTTLDTPVVEKGDLQSTFTLATSKGEKIKKMMEELNKETHIPEPKKENLLLQK
jgi:hypothetical protein